MMAAPVDPKVFEGFEKYQFSANGENHDVYRIGSGPAVLVIHEAPGITPLVITFARTVAARGMTAVMPDLFGTAGREMTMPYALSVIAKLCVSREFTTLALNRTSPVTVYLRALAAEEHTRCGGPGIGAIGMCITGGFALAMSVDPIMLAPVLSQPGSPLPVNAKHRRSLDLSDEDLERVKVRVADGLCVKGFRFTGDKTAPAERFARLRQELGDNFIGVEIDSSEGNPWGYRKGAHSVFTEDYSDAPGSPTRQALDDVLSFFTSKLGVG